MSRICVMRLACVALTLAAAAPTAAGDGAESCSCAGAFDGSFDRFASSASFRPVRAGAVNRDRADGVPLRGRASGSAQPDAVFLRLSEPRAQEQRRLLR